MKMSGTLLFAQCALFALVLMLPIHIHGVPSWSLPGWWQPLAIGGSVLGGVNNALFQASSLLSVFYFHSTNSSLHTQTQP